MQFQVQNQWLSNGTKPKKYIKFYTIWIVLNLYRWPRQESQGSHDGAQCSEEDQAVRHSFFHGKHTISLIDQRGNKLEEVPCFFAVVFFGSPFLVKYRLCSLSVVIILELYTVQVDGRKGVGEKQDQTKNRHGPFRVWLFSFPHSEAR